MGTYEETVWPVLPGRGAPARRADKKTRRQDAPNDAAGVTVFLLIQLKKQATMLWA
jgi:hypothetical protein